MKLSVIIVSWNQLHCLRRLIPQLLAQNPAADSYEIIIVDDGSTDGTVDWLSSFDSRRVRVVNLVENLGRSAARNSGIREAKGELLVMIDGDHEVRRDFLRAHLDRHADERCVVVGESDYADYASCRALNHYLNGCGAVKLPAGSRLPGRYFLTRNCSLPRDVFSEIGIFDEHFTVWGGEDLDLGVRIEKAGVTILAEPRARALHNHQRHLKSHLENIFTYGRDSIPLLLQKHPSLFAELNLDRTLSNPYGEGRFGWTYRLLMRFIMSAPFYYAARLLASGLMRFRAPRVLFDYLHLRQYSRGYEAHLKSLRKDTLHGNTD
jgi:glycosyltransferase involved in cell wall biosynthesis